VGQALQKLQLLSSEEIRKRLQDKRQDFLKAVMTVWSATTEVYLLLSFLVQNCFVFGDIMQLPNFLTCAAANFVFKELRKPGVPLTPHCMQRFTLVMTGATLVFTVAGRRRVEAAVLYGQVGLPRELLPAGYIARIILCALSGNAEFATKVNVAMAPFFVLSHFLQADPDPSMFMLVNEIIAVSLMGMAVSIFDSKEYQIEVAALQLEEKAETVEQLRAAEISGYAVKRLLSVTCDAIVRLNDELRVAEPGRSLADLLMCGLGFKNNSLEGVSFLRYVAPNDHGRLRDFITESSKDDTTPRSLNLQLRDSNGIAFDCEIFHVCVPGLTSQREHLVGITQACADRPVENRDVDEFKAAWLREDFNEAMDTINELPCSQQPDMRHILGYTLKQGKPASLQDSAETASESNSSGSASTKRQYVRLRSLDRVNCVVRLQPEVDRLKAFKDVQGPKFYFDWLRIVQLHLNAAKGKLAKQVPLSEIRMFSPSATAASLLVGDSRVVGVEDSHQRWMTAAVWFCSQDLHFLQQFGVQDRYASEYRDAPSTRSLSQMQELDHGQLVALQRESSLLSKLSIFHLAIDCMEWSNSLQEQPSLITEALIFWWLLVTRDLLWLLGRVTLRSQDHRTNPEEK
ncbi:unnamed protein product, partial [Cladocopium goreaui]